MVQRLGLAGHKSASYSLLAQPGFKALHFVLESADKKSLLDVVHPGRMGEFAVRWRTSIGRPSPIGGMPEIATVDSIRLTVN